jgi:hypothetical protein
MITRVLYSVFFSGDRLLLVKGFPANNTVLYTAENSVWFGNPEDL